MLSDTILLFGSVANAVQFVAVLYASFDDCCTYIVVVVGIALVETKVGGDEGNRINCFKLLQPENAY